MSGSSIQYGLSRLAFWSPRSSDIVYKHEGIELVGMRELRHHLNRNSLHRSSHDHLFVGLLAASAPLKSFFIESRAFIPALLNPSNSYCPG